VEQNRKELHQYNKKKKSYINGTKQKRGTLAFFLFLLLTEGLHVISLYIFIVFLKFHRLHCASQASQHLCNFSEE